MCYVYKKAFVLIGAILIVSPLSLLSYYGNLLPYLASYYNARRDELSVPVDLLWPPSVFRCTFTLAMIFTSPLELRFGIRPCILAGLLLLWASVMCSYIAVKEPLALLVLFGGTHGIAVGILYPTTLKLLLQTFPNKAGLASGLLSVGPVVGALLNIGIAFAVINPNDEKPDLYVDNKVFFSNPKMIQRVPNYFLVAGGCTVAYTFIGMTLAFVGSSNSAPESDSEILEDPTPTNTRLCQQDTGAEKAAFVKSETEHLNFAAVETPKTRTVSNSETEKINRAARTYNTVSSVKDGEQALSGEKPCENSIQQKDGEQALGGEKPCENSIQQKDGEQALSGEKPCENSIQQKDGEQALGGGKPCENSIQEKDGMTKLVVQEELSPRQALLSGRFWCVWLCYLCASHTAYLHLNLYKQYGQLAIANDSMLVTAGMVSMLFTMVGRPSVGICSDRIGIRNTTIAICLGSSLFMVLMVISLHRGSWAYLVFVVAEFLSVSPHTMIFSLLATFEFGKTHCASNMGLITSGNIIVILLEPFIANTLIETVGWNWLFLSGSMTAAVSMVAIMAVECLWQKKVPS
ncbi:hypothetical protein RRG08_033131 [Elysia crispata]|uniref:Major facilitator superfamily (MFS) profile domain-containing protein n=1 Tax=Elysia crispata TaxID=231223 RepID=A0AAE1CQE7_9GAST|nr:hypothetical protein RRG08_033131 [Elysia crispata]